MYDWTSSWREFRDVNLRFDILLRVECLGEGRLENVARVLGALVLQKLRGKLTSAIELSCTEVPVELRQVE